MPLRVNAKRKWARIARIAIPVLAIAGIGIYSYLQDGLSFRMLYLIALFLMSYLYHRFGPSKLCHVNYQLLFPTGFCLWLSFRLWDPSEHLPFGSDMEYPHAAGLAFGMAVGVMVLMAKAFEDDEDEGTSVAPAKAAVHYFVLLSTIAVAGYAMFVPYAFAMYQVFVEGNHIFGLLAIFFVVAFLALAHSRVPHEECGLQR